MFKTIVTYLTMIIIAITIFTQIRYEQYILNQKETYHVLKNKKRLKYSPAILGYFKHRFRNPGDLNNGASGIMYVEAGLKSFKSQVAKDSYFIDSYYTDIEKANYILKQRKLDAYPVLKQNVEKALQRKDQ